MSAPRRWGLDAVRVVALTSVVALHALTFVSVLDAWGGPELLRRDYVVFHEAGRRVLEGAAAELYAPRRFPFLHPPPVAVLSTPLGALDPPLVFLVLTASSLLALALALSALRRLHPRPGEHDVVALAVLASAPWSIALVLGQPLALALAAWLAALLAWQRSHRLTAGLLFGALLLKPPLALAPLVAALVRRDLRMLSGIALAAFALVALALPLGLERWIEWAEALVRTLGTIDDASLRLWKQHTWLAFLRGVLPGELAWVGWALVALPTGVLVLMRVRSDALSLLRRGGLLALATVALSPYAYFYDVLLLVVPAASLWLERETRPRTARHALFVVALLTFAAQHVGFFVLQSGSAWAGLATTVWLALDLFSAPSGSRTPPAAAPGSR
jgi:hypothetical protein